MALSDTITWGATISSDQYTMYRIGHRFLQSPATVTSTTGLVTVTAEIYLWSRFRIWDTEARLYWSGSFGTGQNTSLDFDTRVTSGSGWTQDNIVKLKTLTRQVTASETAAITSSLSASVSNVGAVPGTATTKGSWTTAKKPTSTGVPYPIISVAMSSYNADTGEFTMNLTRDRHNSTTNPYQDIQVQVWTPDRDYGVGGDGLNATMSIGNTWLFESRLAVDNQLFRYRFRPKNAAGTAVSWTYSPFVYSTPLPPVNVKATPDGNGGVTVSWSPNPDRPNSSYYKPTYVVIRKINGGDWDYSLAEEVTGTSWTHPAPDPSATYQYAVITRGRIDETFYADSALAASNTLRLSAPPLTPLILGPLEGMPPSTQVSLHFEHNPADGSEQSGYELEWWTDKDTTVRRVVQTASSWNKVVITTPATADTVRWRVRTKGVHPDFSPWTSTQAFKVSARPTVRLVTEPGVYWGTSPDLRATWVYTDPEGLSASRYEVRTLDGDGAVVKEYAGPTSTPSGGTAWSGSVPDILDGQTLTVQVRVADAHGVFSEWVSASVTADYAEPTAPALAVEWVEETGVARVAVTVPAPSGLEAVPSGVEVFRYDGDGVWERVHTGVPGPDGVMVWEDPSPVYGPGTHNLYVARTVTEYPTYALSPVVLLRVNPAGCEQWFWLASRARPELRVRLRGEPSVKDTAGRDRALRTFWGDEYPTVFSGVETPREVDFSGDLDPRASRWEEWLAVGQAEGSHVYRDPWGRRLTVALDPVVVSSAIHRYEGVSVKMTVVKGPPRVALLDLVAANSLLESGQNVYELIRDADTQVEEVGVNVYELVPRTGQRVSFMEVGANVYALVDWDYPALEETYRGR